MNLSSEKKNKETTTRIMLKKGETRCWCLHHGLFFLDIFPELCIVHDMQVFPLLQHLTRSVCSWALVDMFFMGLLIFVHFSCFIFRRLVDKTRKISSTSSMSSLFSFETKKIINNNTTLSSSQLVSFRIEQINNFLYFRLAEISLKFLSKDPKEMSNK